MYWLADRLTGYLVCWLLPLLDKRKVLVGTPRSVNLVENFLYRTFTTSCVRSQRATEQRTPVRPSPDSTAQPKTKQNTAVCGNVYEANTHVLDYVRIYICVYVCGHTQRRREESTFRIAF